jgi:Ser/Thr protein kinase RdoA (MazF antagonist)
MRGEEGRMGGFDFLSPELASQAIEEDFSLSLDGGLQVYPSYVNRVFGFRDDEGRGFVAKFYRPGRWSREAILEEQLFLADCAELDLPVVLPLPNAEGSTLAELLVEDEEGREVGFFYALFPKSGGRNFEPEGDEDWLRLGRLVGRLHAAGRKRSAPERLVLGPDLGAAYVAELLEAGLVHPDCREDFEGLAREGLELIRPRFEDLSLQRVHGDLHRGNILDRPGSGLVLVDFDDMMTGPIAQDLWLLLPGRREECARELGLLEEGYSEFSVFDPRVYGLIEPLRLLRMLYFLAWRARQRKDYWFRREFPDWGGRAFWIGEVEDLREQLRHLEGDLA